MRVHGVQHKCTLGGAPPPSAHLRAPAPLAVPRYDAKADLWSIGAILYEMVRSDSLL